MPRPDLLAAALELLGHPLVQLVQLQACLILWLGVAGWTLSGLRRRREARRLVASGYSEALAAAAAAEQEEDGAGDEGKDQRQRQGRKQQQQQQQQQPASVRSIYRTRPHSGGAPWPPLALVCPVKGVRDHSVENWGSQLGAAYGGPSVVVFSVESPGDPAAAALRGLMARRQLQAGGQEERARWAATLPGSVLGVWRLAGGAQRQHWVVLVDAGLAQGCSQKIHNILAAIDVALAALRLLLPEQQQQQRQSAAAPGITSSSCGGGGSSGAGAAAGGYVCVLDDDVSLHPLSLGQLVDWMEAEPDLYMATGYPFDIVTEPTGGGGEGGLAAAGLLGRLLSYAAASYHLPLSIGFSAADRGGFVWGGVMLLRAGALAAAGGPGELAGEGGPAEGGGRRHQEQQGADGDDILQVWRRGGYSDDLLLAAHCARRRLPIGLPSSACFPQLLPPAITPKQYWNYLRRQLFVLDTYWGPQNRDLNRALAAAHACGSAAFAAAALATAAQLLLAAAVGGGAPRAAWLVAASVAAAQAAVAFAFSQAVALFRVLSPRAGRAVLAPRFCWALLWLGWLLQNAVLPLCMAYTFACPHIEWGGIQYTKRGGRVAAVQHPAPGRQGGDAAAAGQRRRRGGVGNGKRA